MRTILRLSTSLVHIKSRADITLSQLRWLGTSLCSPLIFPKIPRKFLTSTGINSLKETGLTTLKHFYIKKDFTKFYRFISWDVNSEEGDNSTDSNLHNCISSYDEDLDGNSEMVEHFDPDEIMSRMVYNLAPYVHKSETLQNLVHLGVKLSKVEKVKGIASLLVMSNFDGDILPYLRHLVSVGVAPDKLGHVLSTNPMILTEHMEHLEQRVGYMISKDFTMHDVASMYTRAPVVALMDTVKLDNKLRYFQQAFGLSEHEVRQVVLMFPKILPWKKEKIDDIRVTLEDHLGFDGNDLKLILLREPKLFTANKHNVWKTFDYIHNTMLIPHSLLIKWPSCLRSRLNKLKGRHLFLVHVGRAQYDPYKENYVSLRGLLECTDSAFCTNVAKSTEIKFHYFLKTQ